MKSLATALALLASVTWANVDPALLDACPGYNAQNVQTNGDTLTADLVLAGPCDLYGPDITQLSLEVQYETDTRLHLKITDPNEQRYEVPDAAFTRPNVTRPPESAALRFTYTTSPFSFSVIRFSDNSTTEQPFASASSPFDPVPVPDDVLFTTASHPLIFAPQYWRIKTSLPSNPNVYGLGEHTDPFCLPTDNYTRTLWSRDAYGVPNGTNLYGNHPVYFEHRTAGTHAVFALSSNGMDVKLNQTEEGSTLEYNVIGGIIDMYFLAGSTSDPAEVARQYSQLVGTPAEVPYWSFGLHQCRFGYQNFVDVADVITNYSAAQIPLETMWTDIDYMFKRRTFTTDPDYFPIPKMREIVQYLHGHDQKYILMVDPAVAYLPNDSYPPYDRGTELDVWLKNPNGSFLQGLVWPGVTVFPDWFHPQVQNFWSGEFADFFDPQTGIDVDGAWIDMNEPSSFCVWPCTNPATQAIQQALPPNRTTLPPDPNTAIFVNSSSSAKREVAKRAEHDGQDLNTPPYMINNAAGVLSSKTADTDAVHANGLIEYDTHNLYGTMMSAATREALLARRPGLRTLVITRSTFAGAGAKVGKWLGDNFSDWPHYRNSIAGMLGMATVYQVPMVGADICGYAENTTETLCARWAMLGAFYPFMRNHNADTSISQEFYRWPTVAQAARNALDVRYRLMDYFATAFHQASVDGTPVVNPLFFKYPQDANTFPMDLQFFFGPSVLVSPVTEENSTSVTIYLPNDTFYDFATLSPVIGTASPITLNDVNFTTIPLHIRGGTVLPLRAQGTMTTTQLRETDFELVVAPGSNGTAAGELWVDDGVSLVQANTTSVSMTWSQNSLVVIGDWGYDLGVNVARIRLLGQESAPGNASLVVNGVPSKVEFQWAEDTKVLDIQLGIAFSSDFQVIVSK